jgi:hypothetical protein
MRKISAWLLAAALALSLLPTAFAAEETVITVHPPGGRVKAGDTFTVTVDISGNPGLCGVQFTLTYDHDTLECTDIGIGPVLESMMTVTNPDARGEGAFVGAMALSETDKNGQLATFYFTAKQDSSANSFTLANIELSDYDSNVLPATTALSQTGGSAPSAPSPEVRTPDEALTPNAEALQRQPSTTTQPEQTKPAETTTPTTPESTQTPTTPPTNQTTPTTQPVTPTQIPGGADIAFTDTAGHWAVNWITLAARRGIFKGNPDGTFKPNNPVSRGDYVLTLYRMAGEPALPAGANAAPFADVPATAYYAKAVAWAYANGFVSGRGNGFDPSASVTRQEAMKILFAYAGGQSGMELLLAGIYNQSFADSAEIAEWARPAMYWAVYKGIINGMDGGLAPQGQTTRAQIAKILVEYQDQAEREAAQAAQNQSKNN